MKKLVIHPSDRSTDFLEDIYSKVDCTVIRGDVSAQFLVDQIDEADMVYMLGHGVPQGLLGHGKILIGDQFADLLREKKHLVGIWCNADGYFLKHDLQGLYTGMIISEVREAQVFKVNAQQFQIDKSNAQFAKAVRIGLDVFDPEYAAEQIRELYDIRIHTIGLTQSQNMNPVVEYNVKNIYSTYQITDQPVPTEVEDVPAGNEVRALEFTGQGS